MYSDTKKRKYFLAYLTANDSDFSVDLANIYLMTKRHPGVDKIEVYIIVSEIDTFSTSYYALQQMCSLLKNCKWLSLKKVMLKGNIGRDFSSAKLFLSEIEKEVTAEDIIMIRNRSGYGPFKKYWYASYVKVIDQDEQVGLMGTTINFTGSLDRSYLYAVTHVQTYQYLFKWSNISNLVSDFPGQNSTERLDIIDKGEIGLSHAILKKDLSIACLNWPDHRFTLKSPTDESLPKGDIKMLAKGLPFLHRESMLIYPSKFLRYMIQIKLKITASNQISPSKTKQFY